MPAQIASRPAPRPAEQLPLLPQHGTCPEVALFMLGFSKPQVIEALRRYGYEGKGLSAMNVLLALWDLTGERPALLHNSKVEGKTVREIAETGITGLIFSAGHVTCCHSGRTFNAQGAGSHAATLVVTL